MGRGIVTSYTGYYGIRFFATRLCEKFCLVDTMPDDPEYRRKAARGCVIYFQKILKELPANRENATMLTEEAKRLEKEWKEGPDYERQTKERKRMTSVLAVVVNKVRSHTRPANCWPYEKPPEMRNFPKKPKKKNPVE